MSAQTTYKYFPPLGVAGGIVELSPYAIDAFLNEAADGAMGYGIGVVRGTEENQMTLPTSSSTAGAFLGVTVNGRTTEYNIEGGMTIRKNASIGVMRYGRIYCKVKNTSVTPTPSYANVAAGEPAYLVITGTAENVGRFTNVSGADTIAINGVFASSADGSGIAKIDILNAPVVSSSTYTLPPATATTLGGVKIGSGLSVTADGTLSNP